MNGVVRTVSLPILLRQNICCSVDAVNWLGQNKLLRWVIVIEEVVSTRCLGVLIDNALKWDHHVLELTKSFTQKLNLLKSLYFLPRQVKTDFYFRVILPSIMYSMVCWFGVLVVKAGLLIFCDVAISHNWPQIATFRIIRQKSHNSGKIAKFEERTRNNSLLT